MTIYIIIAVTLAITIGLGIYVLRLREQVNSFASNREKEAQRLFSTTPPPMPPPGKRGPYRHYGAKDRPLPPHSMSGQVIAIVEANPDIQKQDLLKLIEKHFGCSRTEALWKLNSTRENDRIFWFPKTDSYRVGRGLQSLSAPITFPEGVWLARRTAVVDPPKPVTVTQPAPKPRPEHKLPEPTPLPPKRGSADYRSILDKVADIVEADPGIRRCDVISLMRKPEFGPALNPSHASSEISLACRKGRVLYNKESGRLYPVNPKP